MTDVTRVLSQIEQGDSRAAEQLLPLVYDELRKLAASKLMHEQPGQTLEATALVHEAYLRLVGDHAKGADGQKIDQTNSSAVKCMVLLSSLAVGMPVQHLEDGMTWNARRNPVRSFVLS